MPEGVELSEVLGANARELRGLATLDDVAKAARRHGVSWTVSKISDLEHGRVSPTIPTLVITALALSDVCGRNVTVADLLKSDETITLAKGFDISSDALKSILFGDEKAYKRLLRNALNRTRAGAQAAIETRKTWPARLQEVSIGVLRSVYADYGEPEQLLERELGVDRDRLVAEMAALWKKSFHAKRDELAGPDANAQKKGRVARKLKADLKAVLDGDN